MKKRLDDRRGRGRFDVVGVLSGTLEICHRCTMVNLSAGGALIESGGVLEFGSRIDARLFVASRAREIQSEVRRVVALRDVPGGNGRYQLGLEWIDRLSDSDPLVTESVSQASRPRSPERRRTVRFVPLHGAELSWPNWLTVDLIDLSETGVLINSPVPLPVGEPGQLRLRLGDHGFVGAIEVRRVDSRPPLKPGVRLGATFTAMDETSRGALDHFLGAGRR